MQVAKATTVLSFFFDWSWLSLTCVVEAAISGPAEIKFAVEGKAVAEKGGHADNYCRPIKGRLVAASVMLLDFYEKSAIFRHCTGRSLS